MKRKTISYDLRRRIVEAYKAGWTDSYEQTAEMFSVGRATVSRLLRRDRETGDVAAKPRGGDLRRAVELEWLKGQAAEQPDARLVDRVDGYQKYCGRRVSVHAMWNALSAIGWTHKKNSVRKGTGAAGGSRATRSVRTPPTDA